jgi:hypothetical protein
MLPPGGCPGGRQGGPGGPEGTGDQVLGICSTPPSSPMSMSIHHEAIAATALWVAGSHAMRGEGRGRRRGA